MIDKDFLCELYIEKHISGTEIAKLIDIDRQMVYYWLKKFNIPRRKGHTGYSHLEKTNQRQSLDKQGRHFSPTTEFRKGERASPKTEFKIGNHPKSEFKKGHKGSEEQKRKVSIANKGHAPHGFNKETRRKMSESHKGNIPWNKGLKNCFTKETIKKILTRRIPSSLEEKFQKIVDKYDLPYKYVGNGDFFIGRYNPDFINTNSEKIAVEVYANYYKMRRERTIEEYKQNRIQKFKDYGWQILFFDETEVTEQNILIAL